jgi:hypothetical protein
MSQIENAENLAEIDIATIAMLSRCVKSLN